MEEPKGMSHAARIRQTSPGALPLFHQPADHGTLDALARSFNQKRWPSFTEHGDVEQKTEKEFRKALLIRQMEECLRHAPQEIQQSSGYEAARAALAEYKLYSEGTHPSTHVGHKDWNHLLQKQFLQLAQESAKLCGPYELVGAASIDASNADGGRLALFDELDALPRQLEKANEIIAVRKSIESLDQIARISRYDDRQDAYGRWMHHMEPHLDFIDKYAVKPKSNEVSLRESLMGNAQPYRAKPLSLLTDIMGLRIAVARAEEQLFSTRPTMEHCLVTAYRADRKGCKITGAKPYDFTSPEARDSAVMDVVYAARWGAMADRIVGTLHAEGMNVNRTSIATKHAMPKVDKLLEWCGLPPRTQGTQLA